MVDFRKYRTLRSASINSGGNAYSTKTPENDHDPTRSGTDWNVDESAYKLGGQLGGIFKVIFSVFGFNNLVEMLAATVEDIWDGVTNLFIKPLGYFAELVGGLIQGINIPILDPTKIFGLPGLFNDVLGGFKSIFKGWHGSSSSATTVAEAVVEVEDTLAAVRATVAGGYTLQTFTASDAAWVVPDEVKNAAELYAGAFGGGGRGEPGGSFKGDNGVLREGGAGGSSGGYRVEKIDASILGSTLDIQVGAPASTPGADGGISSVTTGGSTVLVESTPNGGSISTPQGYIASASNPGRGGKGGNATSGGAVTAGLAGEDVQTVLGGAGGAGDTHVGFGDAVADNGGSGGVGETAELPMCGGSGGGGGGGARGGDAARGGNGGNGGAPGGGSGGGGAAVNGPLSGTDPGDPGVPGQGLVFLFYR